MWLIRPWVAFINTGDATSASGMGTNKNTQRQEAVMLNPHPSMSTPAAAHLYGAGSSPADDVEEPESELDPDTRPEDLPDHARENLEEPSKIPGPIPDPGPL
ncbi:hypothetical protein [Pseudomonas duriflava]|nr:hypothetical protein [Pseudomonas duriflava]